LVNVVCKVNWKGILVLVIVGMSFSNLVEE